MATEPPAGSTVVMDSESSTLFNPAFCAVLLHKASVAYEAKAGEPMPLTFPYLILPSALHKGTRDALPSTTAASMWTWLRANPLVLMDFAERVRTFRPFTSASIIYAIRQSVMTGTQGAVKAGTLKRRPRNLRPTADWLECLAAAEFLGKWFGGSNTDEATTLAQWGVRP